MFIIRCPRCKKIFVRKTMETICPRCGYAIKGEFREQERDTDSWLMKKIIRSRRRQNRHRKFRRYLYGFEVIGTLIILAIIFTFFYKPSTYPFGEFTGKTTKEDVKKELRFLVHEGSDGDTHYCKRKFYDLEGTLQICYNEDETIENMNWYFDAEKGNGLDDYRSDIQKIEDYYTNLYGSAVTGGIYLSWDEAGGNSLRWEDSEGNTYELDLYEKRKRSL